MPSHSSSVPHQGQPTANATLSPSTQIVFGQIPTKNAVVPVSSSSLSNPLFAMFAKRSLHRVAFVLGLGSAALIGWYIYQQYSQRAREQSVSQLAIELVETENSEDKLVDKHKDTLSAVKQNIEDDLVNTNVVLYQCPRGYFTPCIAPFALKLETFLRVANVPYEIKFKGQPQSDDAPWITIGNSEVSESQKCIPTLCQTFNIDLNKDASESRKSAANLVDNTLDNRIFWGIALWRWVYDSGNSMKEIQPVAVPMASQMISDVSESVKKASWYHGIGRHSAEEVIAKVNKDLNDLSVALGKHNYFMGERPGEVDCNAFAMLSQMVWNMPKSPFEMEIKKYPNLVGFVLRMKEKYWPDWNEILHSPDSESLASESVRLYSTGEFKRSRSGGVSSQSSKNSNIHLSREPSISSTSKSKKSLPEVNQSKSNSSKIKVGSKVDAINSSQNNVPESEVRKANSERSSTLPAGSKEQQVVDSPMQHQPPSEMLHQSHNSAPTTNPFLRDIKIHSNMSEDEVNNLMAALANEQMQNPNSNSLNNQHHYQNSFLASKSAPFPGQILGSSLAPNAYSQNLHIQAQQYGNHAAAYNDQAKFYQIRDAIHAVTTQSSGIQDNYSTNIMRLQQLLNDLTILHPQSFIPRQWHSPAGLQQHPMYSMDTQYGQQLQQPPINSPPPQNSTNPNNPFMY